MLRKIAVLALACVPIITGAQQRDLPVPKDLASIIGVVDDSIRGGRLIGALVTVVGTSRRGTTDVNGIFQIDSITPGAHQIVVVHPLLDTLGLTIQSTPFMLIGGTRQQVGARTPTFEEIRAKSCARGGPVSAGKSILVGRVMQADNDVPAAGATVSLVFKDLTLTNPVERVRNGRADANGNFAICGLPSTIGGNLQATFGGITTADLPMKMTDESIATAILSVGGNGSGTAVLRGKVIAHAGGGPLAGAQVTVVGTTTVVTTADDGTFTLDGLPSGTHEAVVRKIGFAKVSQIVHLATRTPSTMNVVLEQATVLGTIHIVGKMDDGLSKVGFLARKQQGRGWYQTPEQIADKNPSEMSDLMRMTNGMKVLTAGTGRYLMSTSSAGSSKDGCINIFIDRARFDQFQPGDADDAIPVADLGAIEYYREPSSVPTEFTVAGKTCATLVVWTKTLLTTLKP
jgi:Carboxypeptidase regulatory-like domain